jgi:4-coumarate--CoA ligase
VDDDGKGVEEGKPGEILVKGPVVTKGYYGNPQATKDSFIDGWFCTGDIGIWKNGLPYIVDRKKVCFQSVLLHLLANCQELIKYKGIQVAPSELEALLLTHPKILDAAVIGVHTEATEVPRAYVVTGGDVSEEEIMDFVKGEVAGYKRLRGRVKFLDAIPKSPSGKILRKDLRELTARDG